MNKQELIEFRETIEEAIEERKQLGDYNSDSRYINQLLGFLAKLTDHAISSKKK